MDAKLIIHCIGLEGLTITVSGADHSIPMTTDVLRVATLLGSVEYNTLQLPVTYNTADLNGNLIISDVSGKALYRWKSHATVQPSGSQSGQRGSQSGDNPDKEGHSLSVSAPPTYRTAETPLRSRGARALNELDSSRNASSDVEAVAEEPNRTSSVHLFTGLANSGLGNRRTRSGPRRKATNLGSSLMRPGTNTIEDDSASSLPVRKPRRKAKRKSKRKAHISNDSETHSSRSDMPLARKRRSKLRSKVATTNDSDLSSLESPAPRKQRPKGRDRMRLEDLSDKGSEIAVTEMTHNRKIFLRHLMDRLVKENKEDSEPFAEPVDAVAEDVPTYHRVIKRPMDLRTLKENLGKGFYTTVEDFESDFKLIIENSIRFNGRTHWVSQGALRLLNAFNVLMAFL